MGAFRLLHCADLHLEASFASSGLPPDFGNWRRADLRATLGHILSMARERRVNAVTIAGDLYEQDYVTPDTADFLRQQFAGAAPIRICIAPGERDPYTADSLYAITPWPDNVTIFKPGSCTAVELAPGILLWGVAHPIARGSQFGRLKIEPDTVNLFLAHTTLASGNCEAIDNCLSGDDAAIRDAGFDWGLLGHQHRARLWPEGDPFCAYPGSPEPLDPDEADGDHQVFLLTIEAGGCRAKPMPIGHWRYLFPSTDLSDCSSIEEAADAVERTLAAVRPAVDKHTIVSVSLTGCPPVGLDLDRLADTVISKGYVLYEPRFSLPDGLEPIAQERTIRGLIVQRLQTQIADARSANQRHVLLNALQLSLQALEGREVRNNEID